MFIGHRKRLFYVVFGCNGRVEGCFLGDNVSVGHDSPVCSVVFITKQLCAHVRLLRIFWGEGSFDVGVRIRLVEGEGNALFPTCYPFFLIFRQCRC